MTAVRCQIKEDYELASVIPLYSEADARHLTDFSASLPDLDCVDREGTVSMRQTPYHRIRASCCTFALCVQD
jgi:hypothetical protein